MLVLLSFSLTVWLAFISCNALFPEAGVKTLRSCKKVILILCAPKEPQSLSYSLMSMLNDTKSCQVNKTTRFWISYIKNRDDYSIMGLLILVVLEDEWFKEVCISKYQGAFTVKKM